MEGLIVPARFIRLAGSIALLALALLFMPYLVSDAPPSPAADPAGGQFGPVMRAVLYVNTSALLRWTLFLCMAAIACAVQLLHRAREVAAAALIVIDGLSILWIALELWAVFSAIANP